jgi:hypothetical protein
LYSTYIIRVLCPIRRLLRLRGGDAIYQKIRYLHIY